MRTTTLLERKEIEKGVKSGKSYQELSALLKLIIRLVRKWGQKVKKNESLRSVMGRLKTGTLSSFSPQQEKDIFDPVVIYNFLTRGRWFRKIAPNKTFSLGGHLYRLPKAEPNMDIEIHFNRNNIAFDCFDADGKLIDYVQAKGLSFSELCGDLLSFISWTEGALLSKH
jgi:hypothetical protein